MNRKRSRAPSTGRREGAPSGKSGKREKGKRLPGPESPRRDKTLFDGGGGAPHGVPEASMRRVIRGIGGIGTLSDYGWALARHTSLVDCI